MQSFLSSSVPSMVSLFSSSRTWDKTESDLVSENDKGWKVISGWIDLCCIMEAPEIGWESEIPSPRAESGSSWLVTDLSVLKQKKMWKFD